MMKKPLFFGLIGLALVVLGFIWFMRQVYPSAKPIHYHAAFQVYQDGKLQDFSDLKYMHTEPCSQDGGETAPDPQIEKAHLHSSVGDVVHVHRADGVWGDLFKNINVYLPASASGFLNGHSDPNFLTKPIEPYQVLVVTLGDSPPISTLLSQVPTKAYIQQIEAKPDNCGK